VAYRRRRGFTLVELLVVIAIIGVLVGLLLPAVQAARETARRIHCASNVKQIGLALHNYHAAHRSFPPANYTLSEGVCYADQVVANGGRPETAANWAIALLPYVEQEPLYRAYDFDQFNEAAENRRVRETSVPAYVCPADLDATETAVPATGPAGRYALSVPFMPGSYRAVSGRSDGENFLDSAEYLHYPRSWFGPLHTVGIRGLVPETIDNIRDGTSSTLLVGESTTRSQPQYRTFWAYSYAYFSVSSAVAQPRTLWGDYDRCKAADGQGHSSPCKRGWGAMHPGGLNFVLCDGSARFLATDVDPELFATMATIAGNE
jgi:prepilin-type N-terminal cleavage/methylation domain-containing protein/prepilin-type processing-associated H-X9-DG protein